MAFYEGKPCFIRKDADEIKTVSNSSFPKIEISAELASGKKNIQKRLKFMFSMLPQNVRSIFLEQDLMIRAEKTLSRKEYEERGVSGYALQKGGQYQICLKEEAVPYLIETSFFHEAGHILKYIANRNEEEKLHLSDTWKNEIKNLSLREYYHTEAEYMAEIFELYVKNPGYLLENAPDSFQFVTDVLLPDGSTFSVERTEME